MSESGDPIGASGPRPAGEGDAAELAALVERAAGGSERAWEELVARYARRVFAMCHAKLRQPELAEEITQSVFVTVATKLRSDHYTELGRFEAWLFRVTMNRVRDEARRRKRHAAVVDPGTLANAGAASDRTPPVDEDESARLRAALDTLGEADREVIDLRHTGQMSFKDIADLLDQPVGTVLARHHRAIKKLRACLEQDGPGRDTA